MLKVLWRMAYTGGGGKGEVSHPINLIFYSMEVWGRGFFCPPLWLNPVWLNHCFWNTAQERHVFMF